MSSFRLLTLPLIPLLLQSSDAAGMSLSYAVRPGSLEVPWPVEFSCWEHGDGFSFDVEAEIPIDRARVSAYLDISEADEEVVAARLHDRWEGDRVTWHFRVSDEALDGVFFSITVIAGMYAMDSWRFEMGPLFREEFETVSRPPRGSSEVGVDSAATLHPEVVSGYYRLVLPGR